MAVTKIVTTQEAGLPITKEQLRKIALLEELIGIDPNDILNTSYYPSDRWEAWNVFCQNFAFYDMVSISEYEYIRSLLRKVPHLCEDPKKLFDPDRYQAETWEELRWQFEQRFVLFDCFKGIHLILGEPGAGKSCWADVHSHHGKDWYNRGVISYKHHLPEGYGEHEYLSDEDFIDELIKCTEIVNRKGGAEIKWKGDKDKFLTKFTNKIIILEEAHKVVGAEDRTLLSLYWKDVIGEWRHYGEGLCIMLLTHAKKLLDPHRVDPYYTHDVYTSLNLQENDVSDIRIYNRETMTQKPIIPLNRRTYGASGLNWWKHNVSIAMRSNINRKDIQAKTEERRQLQEVA